MTPNLPVIEEESITIDATSGGVGFTSGKAYARTDARTVTKAVCQVLTAPIRVSEYEAPVAATTGFLIQPGQTITITGTLKNFRAIRETATSASLRVQYLGVD
jgi:hypothetical protein